MSDPQSALLKLVESAMTNAHSAIFMLAGLFYVLNDKGVLSKDEFEKVIQVAKNSAEAGPDGERKAREIQGLADNIGQVLK